MLPFLILAAGYNMKRRRFFRNIGPIFLFGVLGTFISFVLIGIGSYLLSSMELYTDYWGNQMQFTLKEGLIMGAVLSASDVVCALSLVQEEKTPRLHSILFGEAVTNDAVAILLFQSLGSVDLTNISTKTVFVFIGEFLYNSISSVILGALFGCCAAYFSRKFEALRGDASNQTALLFYIAWFCYVVAELLGISGVIALLVCAIIMGHYAWYNLSSTAREVTSDTFRFLGDGAEALIFAYLGITAFSYNADKISFYFILAMVGVVLTARFIGTFVLTLLVRGLTCGKFDLPMSSVAVVWVGGTIRGAIAFGLIVTVDTENSDMLILTVLGLVIFTTLVFGTFLPLWIKIVKPSENQHAIATSQGENVSKGILDSQMDQPLLGHHKQKFVITKEDVTSKRSLLHEAWRKFDDKYIKPVLIDPRERFTQQRTREDLQARAGSPKKD